VSLQHKICNTLAYKKKHFRTLVTIITFVKSMEGNF